MNKPLHWDRSEAVTDRVSQPKLPPITLEVRGREVTFVQATDLLTNAVAGQMGAFVMINICHPGQSNVGVYVAMSTAEARNLCDGIMASVRRIERGGMLPQ